MAMTIRYKKVWQKFYIQKIWKSKIWKSKIWKKFQICSVKNGYNKWRGTKKEKEKEKKDRYKRVRLKLYIFKKFLVS